MRWNPHFWSSNLPPVVHSRSCHSYVTCFTLTRNCSTVSPLFSSVTQVKSSTKPIILNYTTTSPLGLAVVRSCASWLWQSNNVLETKYHIISDLPAPCPVPWIGNVLQGRCEVFDIFDDNFNLYSASFLESLRVHNLTFLYSVFFTW